MAARPFLNALAERMGILPAYVDQGGRQQRTSDTTRVALLSAMGIDASTETAARRAIGAIEHAVGERFLDSVRVVRAGDRGLSLAHLRVPGDWPDVIEWHAELHEEGGPVHQADGRTRRRRTGAFAIPLPDEPGLGYHVLRVQLAAPGRSLEGKQTLIVAPSSCPSPAERFGGRRLFGLCANLYTIRSSRNWGIGDLTDLGELAGWSGEIGAAFVGLNPLHALRNRSGQISPYRPLSRLFRNVLYLDVDAVPELGETEPTSMKSADHRTHRVRLCRVSSELRAELRRLRRTGHVEYERVMAVKMPLLELLYDAFVERHREAATARGRAYIRYLREQGEPLRDFATFAALEAHFSRRQRSASDWHAWPAAYRDPRSARVEGFRKSHPREVDFHCYVQFELDRQLAAAAERARKSGLAIGLYQDLALGSAPDGADTWAFPGLFLDGVSLGAPPDQFHRAGQDWDLPPIDPRKLAADGYRYWILVLRAALGHAGALRIDHVVGLFRQFWMPAGELPARGAYVRQPADDLLGILALEAARHGAVVVGEDLGTVPLGLRRTLARWGVLSSKVLYFEREKRGTFRSSAAYAAGALATANTHDLPTLAGFWEGRDLVLRRETGQLAGEAEWAAAQIEREGDRRALLRRLASEELLAAGSGPPSRAALCRAVHAFLSRTPAVLVGVSLDDLVGETQPVNLPGVGPDRYPSWSRRLRLPLEALRTDPGVAEALAGAREQRG